MIEIKTTKIKQAENLFNLYQTSLLDMDNILIDPDKSIHSLENEKEQIKELSKNNNLYLAAWLDNQAVGYLILRTGQYQKNRHTTMLEIFIRPEFRKIGIAQALLKEAFKYCRNNGIKKIELEVWSNNKPAINLYKKLGFKSEGARKKAYKIKSRYIDGILMSKWI